MITPGYILIFIVFAIVSMIVGNTLKSKFRKYSKIPVNYGISGKDVAEKMLRDNGIYDVNVIPTKGNLSDHYNPATKTVALSHEVYYGQNVSAAAVAAHECGHAVQHANAYSMLQLRTALVPIQNVSATILNFVFTLMFFGAFFAGNILPIDLALFIFVACYGVFTLFALITLPVEINASQRALAWLGNSGVTNYGNHSQAKDALKWAAYTYVVAAIASLAMLVYFLLMLLGRRN
ncbi:MAG: zinc metallopeptidase [Bacteroidales bacterium]|nr:zinc metallopeptidase [Bacteroidales bacterium]